MSKSAFTELIQSDIEYLKTMCIPTLERSHIINVLNDYVNLAFPSVIVTINSDASYVGNIQCPFKRLDGCFNRTMNPTCHQVCEFNNSLSEAGSASLPLTTECMIRAGLRAQNCKHSTEGSTGDKATITDKTLHV